MEPQIQYAKTEDRVNIAFSVIGEGPALVIPPNLVGNHVQLGLDMPGARQFYTQLTDRLQIIRYDCRGTGMSQRDVIDFSSEAAERDLQAVVDRLGLDRFAVYGHLLAGEVPITYPAHHPDRVSCLVFWIGQTVTTSPEAIRRLAVLESLLPDEEWDLQVDLRATVMFGLDSPMAKPFADLIRAAHTPASSRAALLAMRQAQQAEFRGDLQAGVTVPALVAHLAGVDFTRNLSATMAAKMPSARIIAIPGPATTLMPFVYDNEVLTTAIAEFVVAASNPKGEVPTPELNLGAMRAILWTDLERHSEMMENLGDAKGREVLREHERITRAALAAHGGTEVKAMGDGFMAWFPSAQRALDCAIALQRSIAISGLASQLRVRIGVNAGEPIEDEDPEGRTDLFGASVIAASRVCGEAAGGQIIVSDVVRQLVAGKEFLFAERGVVALKGFEEPVRLYEVRWQD